MKKFIHCLTFLTTLLITSKSLSAILVTDSEGSIAQLLAAMNVDINGILYDVTFQDGTCVELFNGCNDLTDFTFTNEADATAASQALLDQVLIDTPFPNTYDSNPNFVAGCQTASRDIGCYFVTPYTFISGAPIGAMARNFGIRTEDDISIEEIATYNSAGLPITFAVWTETSAVVPLPAAAGLFLFSSGSLLGLRRLKCKS